MYLDLTFEVPIPQQVSNLMLIFLLSTIKICESICETLETVFECYAHRPCLGYRAWIQNDKGEPHLSNTFTWKTYHEVYERSRSLGSGLRTLFGLQPRKEFVGISGFNCLDVHKSQKN